MTLCCCWPCSIFEALPCRMSCCQLCNQKCINQWPAEPFADFLVMASRHDLGGVLQGPPRRDMPRSSSVVSQRLRCLEGSLAKIGPPGMITDSMLVAVPIGRYLTQVSRVRT